MDSNGEYTVDLNCGFKSFKEVTFIYSDCIVQEGEYTFVLN